MTLVKKTDADRECGTPAKYNHGGCRCDACKAAYAEVTKRYREANAEKVRARKLAYNEKNREREAERARRWYAENKERAKKNAKVWKAKNKDKLPTYDRNYTSKIRLQPGAIFQPDVDYEALWTGFCGICLKPMEKSLPRGNPLAATIDHIEPLSAGGSHTQENIQWAHMACNAGKGGVRG